MKTNDSRYIETLNNIREALSNGNNNVVAEMLECSSCRGFLVEMNSKDRQYYMKIRVDADVEFVMMEIHPNITIGEPYKRMFNQFAMMKSREKKVGNIRIGAGNTAEIYMETSFTNGPVTVEAYDRMEHIAMQFTIGVEDQLDMVAHGIMPEKDEKSKDEEIKEALEHFLRGKSDEEDDDSEETQSGGDAPFGDFLSFLATHASMEPDDEDDESIIDVDVSDGDVAI